MFRVLSILCLLLCCGLPAVLGQGTQPLVAIHDSELTRALESMSASGETPTGSGTTGYQWWPKDWHYFVMPESVKEAMRSDGTAFTVVGDSNITAGVLLTNGLPKYPILISLASEAIRTDEIAALTNYVAAGGFLLVGSSAFTRDTDGTTLGDFAFADELGVHMVAPSLTNWTSNGTLTTTTSHLLTADIPTGQLIWRMPSSSEEISWGISPSHPYLAPHDLWQVQAGDATVIATGDSYPYLLVKPFGKGYFIYNAAFQPLLGHGGFAPGMYAYAVFRRAIEWAFGAANLPVPRLSPWPYPYDAAFMIRHDLENYTNEIARIALSAQAEFNNGAKGDYYFCTGTLRDDSSGATKTAMIVNLRQAVTNYGATIGPHNGGLKNPNNPALVSGDYDYWHWGPDEALDVTPSGYASGQAYASASISNSFKDVEGWLSGITNGVRAWIACYFNATREASYGIESQLKVNITGDDKLTPFPHWVFSTQTANKRYGFLSEPVSDWFVGGLVAQSMENWHPPAVHTSQTVSNAVDFYYGLGALINIYSHCLSTGLTNDAAPSSGDAYLLVPEYLTYSLNTNVHPRVWSANAVGVYQWWLQRSNAQISVNYSTNGSQWSLTTTIKGSSNTNMAVEFLLPGGGYTNLQVVTNGILAGGNAYRSSTNLLNGQQVIKVWVGKSVTNAVVGYNISGTTVPVFDENFDSVTAPALPSGWTTSAGGAQSSWVTRTTANDTAPNAAFSTDAAAVGTSDLVSPSIVLPGGQSQLSFRNNYNLEAGTGSTGYDGGVLEIKIGAGSFTDILAAGGSFVSGGYNSTISILYSNVLAGRQAWSGDSGGFITTLVDLPAAAAGQSIQLRWRCGTDNSNGSVGWYIDTVAINNCACACCWNTPPLLPAQSNRSVNALSTLTVTNTATDADYPPQILTYTLLAGPTNASISAKGVITWTPTPAQAPGTNTITTRVTDGGMPGLSDTNSFTVVVQDVNVAPVLPVIPTQTVNELTLLTVTNTAFETNLHATLGYRLVNAPIGAAIGTNGIITWTPSQTQSPSTNTITTVVTNSDPFDPVNPHLSATNSFSVIVREVNIAPVLPVQTNRTIGVLTALSVTNTAVEANIHATLGYTLVSPPSGASINSNGVITWTPSALQSPSTNTLTTVVTNTDPYDLMNPHLSATNSFKVVVLSGAVVVLDSTVLTAEGCFPTNNVIDPGETVTVLFALKNVGGANTTNLVVTLLQTNGVTGPSGPQSYGVLVVGGPAVSQPFTFAAGGICGSNLNAVLQLQDGATNYGTVTNTFILGQVTVLTQTFDSVIAPALPSGWTSSASNAQSAWVTTSVLADTSPNSAYSTDANNVGVNELVSPPILLPSGQALLSFRHSYAFEASATVATNAYDGGVLEIKIGTNAFTDITNGGSWIANGYNRKIDTLYSNPLAGRWAWSGTNGGFVTTTVSLPPAAAGQTIQLRWRAGTDSGNGGGGWWLDTVSLVAQICCMNAPPVLPGQTNRTVAELATLVVTNTANSPGSPANPVTYLLVNPPPGATINTNGVITWTPTQAQSPSTNTITTAAINSGVPSLSVTNSFTVVVQEVNVAPVLPVIANQTVNELTLLTVTNTAFETNIHAPLGYRLVNPPAGASIDANGIITWTPSQTQSPSTNTLTTVVTNTDLYDLVNPHLSATNSFTVIVREVNVAPVLPVVPYQTVNELTLLTVTNTAFEANIHAVLGYALVNPPTGATIDANGIITWTPSQTQSPSTNTLTTVVTNTDPHDLVNPHLSTTNSFTVIVREVNVAPFLPVIPDQTVNELTLLTVTNTAFETNIHAALGYALVNPPAGAAIDANGIIAWTPSQTQSPSTNTITTVVTNTDPYDLVNPHLSTTNSFTVIVREVNVGPVLPVVADQTVSELTVLTVTNTAFEINIHAAAGYALVNPPAGAAIDADGIITWTPSQTQSPSTNTLTTVVTNTDSYDLVNPHLSATNSFTVIVREVNVAPILLVIPDQTVNELTLLTVTNTAFETNIHAALGYALVNPPAGAAIDADGIITWTPSQAQSPSTNTLTTVVTNTDPYDLVNPHLSATNSFNVIVNDPSSVPQPVIQSISVSNGIVTITWSAIVGHSYMLERKDDLEGTNWTAVLPGASATGTTASGTDAVGDSIQRFYRAVLQP